MIDIILCCYNQEKYIEQALTSIYLQNFSDKANLIVADDSSSDRTLEIIENIPSPAWINKVCLPSEKNMGLVQNYKRAFHACKSDFIFILEGDDFWSSPEHLKQHVEFLRNNPDISMSMNKLTLQFVVSGEKTYSYWQDDWKEFKKWNLREQILANRLGNLSGCCFRGELIRKLPNRLFKIYFADWLLGMIMAEHGDIAILEKSTSTYRIQPNGQWSGLSPEEQKKELIKCATVYDDFFKHKYRDFFSELSRSLGAELPPSIVRRVKQKIKRSLKKIWRIK